MGKSAKLGLLGGSFDPIHRAHIAIAQQALENLGLDEVHFIVAKQAPHKSLVLDAEKRYQLVCKALEGELGMSPSRIELERDGISYTYLTVEDYRKRYPDAELVWILGEDAFASLEGWKNYDYLAANLEFYVVPRELDIASRNIREQITNKEAVQAMLPSGIEDLVQTHYNNFPPAA